MTELMEIPPPPSPPLPPSFPQPPTQPSMRGRPTICEEAGRSKQGLVEEYSSNKRLRSKPVFLCVQKSVEILIPAFDVPVYLVLGIRRRIRIHITGIKSNVTINRSISKDCAAGIASHVGIRRRRRGAEGRDPSPLVGGVESDRLGRPTSRKFTPLGLP